MNLDEPKRMLVIRVGSSRANLRLENKTTITTSTLASQQSTANNNTTTTSTTSILHIWKNYSGRSTVSKPLILAIVFKTKKRPPNKKIKKLSLGPGSCATLEFVKAARKMTVMAEAELPIDAPVAAAVYCNLRAHQPLLCHFGRPFGGWWHFSWCHLVHFQRGATRKVISFNRSPPSISFGRQSFFFASKWMTRVVRRFNFFFFKKKKKTFSSKFISSELRLENE